MKIDLRSMTFNIGWNINESPLMEANAATDAFRNSVLGMTVEMEGFGVTSEAAAMQVTDGMREAQYETQQLGEQTWRATEEMTRGFNEANRSMSDMIDNFQGAFGALKSSVATLAAGGVLKYFTGAAIGSEAVQAKFKWFASETESDFTTIDRAIKETMDLTHGFFSENQLQEAYMSNANLGADFFDEFIQSAAVLAVKTEGSVGQTMQLFGNAINSGAIKPLINLGVISEETFAKIGEPLTDNIKEWNAHRKELLLSVAAQDFLISNIKDMNEYFNTTDVRLRVFKHHWNDIAGIMGSPIMQPLNQLLGGMNELFLLVKESPIGQFALKAFGWSIGIASLGVAFMAGAKALKVLWPMVTPLIAPFVRFWAIATAVYLVVEDLAYAFFGLGDSVTENLFNAAMEFLGFDVTFEDFRATVVGGLQEVGSWFVGVAGFLKDNWEWISPFVIGLAASWTGYKFALLALQSPIIAMTALTKGWAIAQGLVNIAMRYNPFTPTIALIGTLIGAGILLYRHWDDVSEFAGKLWSGLKSTFGSGVDWVNQKLTDWKDWGLQKIDELAQGFLNLPSTVMQGLRNFGADLKVTFTDALGGLRNMLPFSPAKEGPLVDLHESGMNIIGNIQEGINMARGLSIDHKISPAARQVEKPSLDLYQRAGSSTGSVVFSPNMPIEVHIHGGASDEQVRKAVKAVEGELMSMLEDVFRRLSSKVPVTTEM